MAQLTIYSQLGDVLERHPIAGGTLADWLAEHVPSYADLPAPPYSAELNGRPWSYVDHAQRELLSDDEIELTLRAKDPVTATLIAITALTVGYSIYVYSNMPDTGYQSSTPEGASSYNLNIRANRARLNGVIPHIAGSFPRFPDLLTSIHRAYEDHKEVLYLMYSLGVGRYNTAASHVYISETPIASYNDSSALAFYPPGADVSADEAAQNWYTSKEIGGSRGSSGLEIKNPPPDSDLHYDFVGDEIFGVDDGSPVALPYVVDDVIEIYYFDDDIEGYYKVVAVDGFSPYGVQVVRLLTSAPSDVDPDWSGFGSGYIDTAAGIARVPSNTVGPWSNWYTVGPEGELVHALEVDYRFPRGLMRVTGGGSDVAYTVQFEIEVDHAGGAESFVFEHTDKTRDVLQYTWRDDYGTPRSDVRVRFRRLTIEHVSVRYTEDLEIVRVKARLAQNNSYADVTAMTLKLVGTNTLAASAENQINLRGDSRLLPTLANLKDHLENATALSYSATSSIARFVAWTMYDMLGDDALDAIDWDRMTELEALWASRGDELNGEFTDETTLWEALKLMLAPGFAEPIPREGRVTAIRNQASTEADAKHFYTPDVMLGEGLTWAENWYNDAEPDGIDVEIIDPDTGKATVVECRLPGDLGLNPKRRQLIGVTDETQAWRYGMRERRRLRYKPATLNFETELDALNSQPGDIIALASDLDMEQYGVVRGFDGVDTVTVERPLSFDGSGMYYAAFRKPNGRMSGLYEVEPGPAANQMVLTEPSSLDFDFVTDPAAEPTYYSMGEESDWGVLAIVREISPNGFAEGRPRVQVVAEEYLDEIYADDDNYPGSGS